MFQRRRPWKNALLIALLLAVAWSRVWAAVPQTVAHDHAHDAEHVVEFDVFGDQLTVASHHDHHELIDVSPHDGANDTHDLDGDHHHHLHLCNLGGSALTAHTELHLMPAKAVQVEANSLTAIIRRHERLLRPPQA